MCILIIYFLLTIVVACNAISCYRCDSIAMAECAMTLNSTELPFVNCPPMSLQCLSSIVDSVTYRGCSSETPVSDDTFSSYCKGNLCNKGVYPPGRRKCYQCSGTECSEKPQGKPQPCRWHHENDECFTDVSNDLKTYRGCRTDTNYTLSTEAIFCKYNGCNDLPTIKTLTCALCDSMYSRGCKIDYYNSKSPICNITQYETCQVKTFADELSTCFSYHNLDRVVRGCTSNMPEQLDKNYVVECNDQDYCNSLCLQKQMCFRCSSSEDPACLTTLTDIHSTTCSSTETSSCFVVKYANNSIERGCGTPPNNAEIKRKYECDGPGCNSVGFTRCYQCSSESSTVCAAWDIAGFGINIEECIQLDSACVTAELKNGTILRGCESNSLSCSNNQLADCQRCEGSFCNTQSLHRLHCYQCYGTAECETVLNLQPTPCPSMEEMPILQRQACLTYNNPLVGIVRGCQIDTALYYECLLINRGVGCQLCYEGGCNKKYSVDL